MTKSIPKNPVLLAIFLGNLIAGDDKHQQDHPLPKDLRAEMEAAKAKLTLQNTSVQLSKGQYRSDFQIRRDYVATVMGLAERGRDGVLSSFGQKNEVLVDFGLATRRKRAKAGSAEVGTQSERSKAEKKRLNAQLRVSKAQVQFEKAQAKLSRERANLSRREAEATLVAQAPSPEPKPASEPTPSSEPTPPSVTK